MARSYRSMTGQDERDPNTMVSSWGIAPVAGNVVMDKSGLDILQWGGGVTGRAGTREIISCCPSWMQQHPSIFVRWTPSATVTAPN